MSAAAHRAITLAQGWLELSWLATPLRRRPPCSLRSSGIPCLYTSGRSYLSHRPSQHSSRSCGGASTRCHSAAITVAEPQVSAPTDQLTWPSRTDWCGKVGQEDVGKQMTICGWVHRTRSMGGVFFADLRDSSGLLQVRLTLLQSVQCRLSAGRLLNVCVWPGLGAAHLAGP